jgi:thiamine biosynthesis lipoprotein
MSATVSFPTLGTTATLVVADAAALPAAQRVLRGELDRIDRACSRFRSDSELSRANGQAGRRVRIGALLTEAIAVGLDAAEATGGLVTPTLGGSLTAAGYDRTFRLVRHGHAVAFEAVPHGLEAWRRIELDRDERRLLVPAGLQLDLGATAKALAADRAAHAIATRTGTAVLVSLGGDIAVAGHAPPGGWAIRIAEDHAAPLDTAGPVVAISTGGLATSSTSVRRWRTRDAEVHHLFDPRTGAPADSGWRTVTATGTSCVEANVTATLGIVDGRLRSRSGAARVVRDDGSVLLIGDWPDGTAAG